MASALAPQPDIMRLAESGKAEELYESLKLRALSSLFFFSKVILTYKEMSPVLHQIFCNRIQEDMVHRKRGYLMPRGHFKSTVVSKAYPLWRFCHDPEIRILIVGESDTVASKNLKDIKWNLLNNQMLRWLFPEIIPPDTNKTKWTDTEILLPRHGTYDESTITTVGVGAKTTGFHYSLIIYDDMIGEKASKSEAEMMSAINWFQYAPGLLDDPAHGEEMLIGTRWKHDTADLYGYIMAELQEGESESGRKTGFKWYIRAAIEDDEPIFPERFSLETLEEIRHREGDYKFSCQYMNNPTAPGAADFAEDWVGEYTVSEDGKTIIPKDGSPHITLSSLLRMSFYDPSAGGKSATAQNAVVGAGMASDRRIFVFFAWARNCTIREAMEQWYEMNDRYQCYKNHYESVGAQKSIEDIDAEIRSAVQCRVCKKRHRKIQPIPIKPPGGQVNKEDRIRMFAQAPFQEKRVYLRRGMSSLRNQITQFPHSKFVDMFDALAYLCNLLRAPLSDEEIIDIRTQDEKAKMLHSSRTFQEHNRGGYA